MELPFYKYQGTGNDFVIIDNRDGKYDNLPQPVIARLCNRRLGIGADGLMLLNTSSRVDFAMKYFNRDGRESTMCGNGGRCLVAFAHQKGIQKDMYVFEAIDGLHRAEVVDPGEVRLEMSRPSGTRVLREDTLWIDTGSPHFVQFREGDWKNWEVFQEGQKIRYSREFAPEGTNVNFVKVLSPHKLAVRTYERGVEEETLSCGTGVTAAAYLHLLRTDGLTGKLEIQTLGGQLLVEIQDRGGEQELVYLQGPATFVYEGSISLY